jgi:hypothetical protein
MELAHIVEETLKITVNANYCTSVEELISEFPPPNWMTLVFADFYEELQTALR